MNSVEWVVTPSLTVTPTDPATVEPTPTPSATPIEQATATPEPSPASETTAATQVVQVDSAQYGELMLSFQVMGVITCLILFFVVVMFVLQIGGRR